MSTELQTFGRLQRVQGLSTACPHCDLNETTAKAIHIPGLNLIIHYIHCEWCQSDYDPLDANPLDTPIKLEGKIFSDGNPAENC